MPYALLDRYITNQIATNTTTYGTNETQIFFGDWSKMTIGVRQPLLIEVTREAGSLTGSAFASHEVWIKVTWRGHVALTQPTHFAVIVGQGT